MVNLISLLNMVKENHICGEWSNICGFNVRLEDGGIRLSSDTNFQLPGMSEMADTAIYSVKSIILLPQEFRASLEEVLSKYIKEISDALDELYVVNSSTVLDFILDDKFQFVCQRHPYGCSAIAEKFARTLIAVLCDIENIGLSTSITSSTFDSFALIRRFSFGMVEVLNRFSYDNMQQYMSVFFHGFDPLTSRQFHRLRITNLAISKQAVDELSELTRLKEYLYSSRLLKPIRLTIKYPHYNGCTTTDKMLPDLVVSHQASSDDVFDEVKTLIEFTERNHILFSETRNGITVYSKPGYGLIEVFSKEFRHSIDANSVSQLPISLCETVRDVLAEQMRDWVELIREWYRECAPVADNYSPSDTDRQYLTCCMHGDSCGELVTSVRRLILALVTSIEETNITLETEVPFDDVVLQKIISSVNGAFFRSRGHNLVPTDVLKGLCLGYPSLDEYVPLLMRQLIDLWTALYRESVIEPFTLTIDRRQRDEK